jgi:PD-(D/E)XK nuclease superfamily
VPQQFSLFDLFDATPPRPVAGARVIVAPGPIAAEGVVWEVVDPLLAAAVGDPSLLGLPVRLVVPSRSLRLHLAARLVARRGRPAAGVVVQTLRGLAMEVLERSGEAAPRGAPVFDVLARRFARGEPTLSRALEDLVDGYAAVAGTVRDLLDAGMEPEHVEAALEALAAAARGSVSSIASAERAGALVRVAARVEAAARQLGIGRASHLLRRAAELLRVDPDRVLPTRALVVHGFGDATGLATDLIQALLRLPDACLVLDRPPDPARSGERGEGEAGAVEAAFTERFARRLSLAARLEAPRPAQAAAGPARLVRRAVQGAEAEARAAADAVRALLDGGARPEGIGLVARDLAPYRFPLRRHLARLGVPFSGIGARGGLGPIGRRGKALVELLRGGRETPCDRWLDAALSLPGEIVGNLPRLELARAARRRADLRLALRALGAARLHDLPGLDLDPLLREDGRYPLPARLGLREAGGERDSADDTEEGENGNGGSAAPGLPGVGREGRDGRGGPRGGQVAPRRTVSGEQLARVLAAAGAVAARFAAWPDQAPAGDHFARLGALLREELGWERSRPEIALSLAALEALEREVPAELRIGLDELRLLVARALEPVGSAELGGAGGGVQVLGVIEARARTFEHLFVLGLNRDVFPRPVREDPLLPDGLRLALAGPAGDGVLPDVPVKRVGFDEERYLFAQLLAAAPEVTLSWQTADDDGRAASPSPLVERLPPPAAGEDLAPPPGRAALRPPDELAVLAALAGDRRRFGEVLAEALAARTVPPAIRSSLADLDPAALAAARVAVLDELDPDLRTPEGRATRLRLGPYLGLIGAGATGPSARSETLAEEPAAGPPLYVTLLENVAACPWQAFLTRFLRLEPTPDPLQALPGLDALLLGNAVHAVLERIVFDALPGPAAWPAEEHLERILREECARAVRSEGIALAGLARALAARARPFLAIARQTDWAAGAVAAQAVECEGGLAVADGQGRPRQLAFKADRADPASPFDLAGGEPHPAGATGTVPDGPGLVFTDYKTGKPPSEAVRPDFRRKHFLERVRTGRLLQAAAYALAAGPGGRGRYLYLRPDEPPQREFPVEPSDVEVAAAFRAAVAAALAAWDAGVFTPRLVDASGRKEPARCKFCEVAEACLRRDSGARLRLGRWVESGVPGDHPGAAELLGVWWMGDDEHGPRPGGPPA